MNKLRVVIWHRDKRFLEHLKTAATNVDLDIVESGYEGEDLVHAVIEDDSIDLIICGVQLQHQDAIGCLLEIASHRLVPAVVVADEQSVCRADGGFHENTIAYIIEPVHERDASPTIYLSVKRLQNVQHLREEVDELRSRIDTRKKIEHAKALIMRIDSVEEPAAYERLRRLAMNERIKLVDAAELILKAEVI